MSEQSHLCCEGKVSCDEQPIPGTLWCAAHQPTKGTPGNLCAASFNVGSLVVSSLYVKPGQCVTVYLHTSDVERERTVHAVELHVDRDGVPRVVLDDHSLVSSYKMVYGQREGQP